VSRGYRPIRNRLRRKAPYPGRPLRILAGFAAGGGVDITARLTGQWLSERLGQAFLTENRTGADGNIATEAMVNAPADGYTLLLACLPNAVNASLYPKLSFNFMRDTASQPSSAYRWWCWSIPPFQPAPWPN
jgi:tripartite-type tricarboxylate transporter receptor subunit TctC